MQAPAGTGPARPGPAATGWPTGPVRPYGMLRWGSWSPLATPGGLKAGATAQNPTSTPVPTPDDVRRTAYVPILMYHYISEPPPGSDPIRIGLSVSPGRFESHLEYLRDNGYHTITLDDLYFALTQGRPLPARPVVLTFDDGYEDAYSNAYPLLKKYGMTGTFFLITDFLDQGRPGYLIWPQVEEMAAGGERFGSHTRNHADLSGRSVHYLVWQALGGIEAIQKHLGYHPRWICYPSGSYDSETIAVYKSANYWGGLTTRQGATHSSDGLFTLTHVRVDDTYSAQALGWLLQAKW